VFHIPTVDKMLKHDAKPLLIEALDAIRRGDYPRMPGPPELVTRRLPVPASPSDDRPVAPPPPAAATHVTSPHRKINDENMGVLLMN